MKCLSCQAIAGEISLTNAPRLYDGEHWVLEHVHPANLLGWVVIVLRRHAAALHELTDEESRDLGVILPSAVRSLHTCLDIEKEYVAQFADAPRFNHVHFHLFPKPMNEFPGKKGMDLFRECVGPRVANPLPSEKTTEFALRFRTHFENALSDQ